MAVSRRARASEVSTSRIEAATKPGRNDRAGPSKSFFPNSEQDSRPAATTAQDSEKRAYQFQNPHDALCLASAEPRGLQFCWCKCIRCWDPLRFYCVCKHCDCRAATARALHDAEGRELGWEPGELEALGR